MYFVVGFTGHKVCLPLLHIGLNLGLSMPCLCAPDSTLFPLLCIVMLPAWLLLAGKPMMMAWRNDK